VPNERDAASRYEAHGQEEGPKVGGWVQVQCCREKIPLGPSFFGRHGCIYATGDVVSERKGDDRQNDRRAEEQQRAGHIDGGKALALGVECAPCAPQQVSAL